MDFLYKYIVSFQFILSLFSLSLSPSQSHDQNKGFRFNVKIPVVKVKMECSLRSFDSSVAGFPLTAKGGNYIQIRKKETVQSKTQVTAYVHYKNEIKSHFEENEQLADVHVFGEMDFGKGFLMVSFKVAAATNEAWQTWKETYQCVVGDTAKIENNTWGPRFVSLSLESALNQNCGRTEFESDPPGFVLVTEVEGKDNFQVTAVPFCNSVNGETEKCQPYTLQILTVTQTQSCGVDLFKFVHFSKRRVAFYLICSIFSSCRITDNLHMEEKMTYIHHELYNCSGSSRSFRCYQTTLSSVIKPGYDPKGTVRPKHSDDDINNNDIFFKLKHEYDDIIFWLHLTFGFVFVIACAVVVQVIFTIQNHFCIYTKDARL